MKKAPWKWRLSALVDYASADNCHTEIRPGYWIISRPLGLYSLRNRLRLAWLVFTGQADAVVWPEDEPAPDGSPVSGPHDDARE